MTMTLKKVALSVVGIAAATALVYAAGVTYDLHRSYDAPPSTVDADARAQVERGRYIAYAADCAACHTLPGGKAFAGGYGLDTPFGTILASNITQDPSTGIGGWTFEQFDRAVRHGKGSHGYLYPAMPYTAYARMTDNDMHDLWAYMKTIAPVSDRVVENQLPFPFNQRWLLGGWNLLFFHPQVFVADGTRSADYNRGAYLVEGPGHCAACHTAKNSLGGDVGAHLQGARLAGWHAPDLTSNSTVGLGKWSEADIAEYLKTGTNAWSAASGPMTEAVENSTQHLSPEDLHAIAVYLKALPPSDHAASTLIPQSTSSFALGKRVYETQCAACHGPQGEGVRAMIPTFAGSPAIQATDATSLLHVLLKGEDGPQTLTNPTAAGMPSFAWRLTNEEAAAALTYIRNAWGNAAPAVTPAQARQARSELGAAAPVGD